VHEYFQEPDDGGLSIELRHVFTIDLIGIGMMLVNLLFVAENEAVIKTKLAIFPADVWLSSE